MTIQEKIKKVGEGKYKIKFSTIKRYSFESGRTVTDYYFVEYKNNTFITETPCILLKNLGDNFSEDGSGAGYCSVIVSCERYFRENEYESQNSHTQEFELVIGINQGYNHNNDSSINIYELYQEVAEKIYKEDGTYISATITESKVIYSASWGCPAGGEIVYSIKGTKNPQFVDDFEKYKKATERVAKTLASELKQSTFTLTWKNLELNYFKKIE